MWNSDMQIIMIPFVHTGDGKTECMITAGIQAGFLDNVVLAATFTSGTPQLLTSETAFSSHPFPSTNSSHELYYYYF